MLKSFFYIILFILLFNGCTAPTTNTSNTGSPTPIKYDGADSIKLVDSDLSYHGIHLGKMYCHDSVTTLHNIDTYYTHYNPEGNNHIPNFVTDIHTELEDYRDPDLNCKVYRGLNTDIVYKIEITINRVDTALVNAYVRKYGKNNCYKWKDNNWIWEFKNQSINLWLMDDYTSIEYNDSLNLRIHELEVDSIKNAYKDAILKYNQTLESQI